MTSALPPLLALSLAGCTVGPETGDSAADAALVAVEAQHGALARATLVSPTSSLAAGRDVRLSWAELSRDLLGHDVVPTVDVVQARLFVFNSLPAESILAGLATESLDQGDVGILAATETAAASCLLSDFELQGHWILPETDFVEGSGTWLVELLDGEATLRALSLFEPRADKETSEVAITDDTSSLTVTVDTSVGQPISLPSGGRVTLDWSSLDTDLFGNELTHSGIDRVEFLRVAELPTDPWDLPSLDERILQRWTADVSGGTTLDLDALDGEGDFTVPNGDGATLLALHCGRCTLPIPRFLATLEAAD